MNQVETQEKLQELFNDEKFKNKFFSLKSAEEMSDELAKHEIDISAEELRKIYSLAKKKEAGELSDEELENVAGGFYGLLALGAAIAFGFDAGYAQSRCK